MKKVVKLRRTKTKLSVLEKFNENLVKAFIYRLLFFDSEVFINSISLIGNYQWCICCRLYVLSILTLMVSLTLLSMWE
jgi:hypothetical protein